MIRRTLFLIAILLCAAQPAAAQQLQPPDFAVTFTFQPPLGTQGQVPNILLEICGDEFCNRIQSIITLECLAVQRGGSAVYFNQCATRGMMTPGGASAALVFLSRPVTLRLRMNAMTSNPFFFSGAQPSQVGNTYDFPVQFAGSKFFIQNQ